MSKDHFFGSVVGYMSVDRYRRTKTSVRIRFSADVRVERDYFYLVFSDFDPKGLAAHTAILIYVSHNIWFRRSDEVNILDSNEQKSRNRYRLDHGRCCCTRSPSHVFATINKCISLSRSEKSTTTTARANTTRFKVTWYYMKKKHTSTTYFRSGEQNELTHVFAKWWPPRLWCTTQ